MQIKRRVKTLSGQRERPRWAGASARQRIERQRAPESDHGRDYAGWWGAATICTSPLLAVMSCESGDERALRHARRSARRCASGRAAHFCARHWVRNRICSACGRFGRLCESERAGAVRPAAPLLRPAPLEMSKGLSDASNSATGEQNTGMRQRKNGTHGHWPAARHEEDEGSASPAPSFAPLARLLRLLCPPRRPPPPCAGAKTAWARRGARPAAPAAPRSPSPAG